MFDGETNGDCTPQLRRIRVEVNLAPVHRVKTLAHELGHALVHLDVADRGLKELEAESVAYIVCHVIGIESDGWSFGYVASWAGGGGGDQAIAAIKTAGTRIQRTADHILSALQLSETADANISADVDS